MGRYPLYNDSFWNSPHIVLHLHPNLDCENHLSNSQKPRLISTCTNVLQGRLVNRSAVSEVKNCMIKRYLGNWTIIRSILLHASPFWTRQFWTIMQFEWLSMSRWTDPPLYLGLCTKAQQFHIGLKRSSRESWTQSIDVVCLSLQVVNCKKKKHSAVHINSIGFGWIPIYSEQPKTMFILESRATLG